ncbi:MAG: glutaminyl-peptide cyclotransferase [Burkholderiales bacterium]|nr:glutaminyl-peptide cyclotransferase [Bacteroidia bacterium]
MNHKIKSFLFIVSIVSFFGSCGPDKPKPVVHPIEENEVSEIPLINYSIVKSYPHDINSFTEGFLFHDQKLFESTGAPDNLPQTKSLFGIVDLKTGKIDVKAEIDRNIYFGEGIVILKGKVFQLTWKNQTAFIYDAKTFKNIGKFNYTNKEGWGLTTDGNDLIMSDGTNYLTYLDPDSLNVSKIIDVKENGYVVINLNELEYIKGFIYANIYTTNTIVKIDPNTGNVVGKMDLSDLSHRSKTENPNASDMNGIAYDSISNKVLVTGKFWPTIYEITFPL